MLISCFFLFHSAQTTAKTFSNGRKNKNEKTSRKIDDRIEFFDYTTSFQRERDTHTHTGLVL